MRTSALLACSLMLLGLVSKPLYSQQQEACTITDKSANLDFVLLDMDGVEVTLSDYLGRVILLDFWATWCAPCRIEIPGFIELLDKYEAQGLSTLGISVDDSVASLQLYAVEMEMDDHILIGGGRDDVKDAFGHF